MHELAVTKKIAELVLEQAIQQRAQRVITVNLLVGKTRNLEPRWVQHYYDLYTKETIAAGARVHIEYVPVAFYCNECGITFAWDMLWDRRIQCPECSGIDYTLVCGRELLVKSIEVQ